MLRIRSLALTLSLAALGTLSPRTGSAFDVVLSSQGEYLDAYLMKPSGIERSAFVSPDDPTHGGRHINGQVCFFPPGVGHDGEFVASDDTFDEVCVDPILRGETPPPDRCTPSGANYVGNNPPGWVVMRNDGSWTGRVIHAAGCGANGQGDVCDLKGVSVTNPQSLTDLTGPMATQGTIDPQGCFFDKRGNLWGTDVGHDGDPTDHDGSLLVFFAEGDYHDYCFVDRVMFSPAMPSYDAATDTIYVSESGAGRVDQYTGLLPTSAADCAFLPDHTVTLPPLKTTFATFPLDLTLTPAEIVRKPASDHFYLASVLLLGSINEIDAHGLFIGFAAGPFLPNLSVNGIPVLAEGVNPEGVGVGSDGSIYFSDLNLQTDPTNGEFFSTGCGRLWKAGDPEPMARHLRFPDGVTVVSSDLLDLSNLAPPSDSTFCPSE